MSTPKTFAEFESQSLAQGYDEVLERVWTPNQVVDTHTHPFDVCAWVVEGGLSLHCGNQTRVLSAGDSFELPRDTPHAEHYGPQGATFWVARKRAAV